MCNWASKQKILTPMKQSKRRGLHREAQHKQPAGNSNTNTNRRVTEPRGIQVDKYLHNFRQIIRRATYIIQKIVPQGIKLVSREIVELDAIICATGLDVSFARTSQLWGGLVAIFKIDGTRSSPLRTCLVPSRTCPTILCSWVQTRRSAMKAFLQSLNRLRGTLYEC